MTVVLETPLTLAELGVMMRDALKDKSWEDTSLGKDVAAYLYAKRRRLTPESYVAWESALDKLCWHFVGLELRDLEPPVGGERLEEFLDHQWGTRAPRTFNKNLAIVSDFFLWCRKHERMIGDPTVNIDRARTRDVHRTTFTGDQRRAIIAAQDSRRDRICLRLLLDYGLRKGALRQVQFKHFDHQRRKLTIFTKAERVRDLPLPHVEFWRDLEHHILDISAQPNHYLLCTRTPTRIGYPGSERPDAAMGGSAVHYWWYACLQRAGVVDEGVTSGEKMHKARHTAGQRVLDHTGNLKAVQKLLGHASMQTTADVYVDWDDDQLAKTMAAVLDDEVEL
jgi:integrase